MLMNFATFGTLNIVSKCRFFFIFKHLRAPNRSWKIIHGCPGKVLDFFISKRVGTLDDLHAYGAVAAICINMYQLVYC